jgi:hypothetical protein
VKSEIFSSLKSIGNSSVSRYQLIIIITLALVASILSLTLFYNNSSENSPFGNLLINPIKESFTEIYFTDYLKLPRTIEEGKKFEFSFVIVNSENRDINYNYIVRIVSPGLKQLIKSDIIKVDNGQSGKINVSFLPKESINNGTINVELVGMSHRLH